MYLAVWGFDTWAAHSSIGCTMSLKALDFAAEEKPQSEWCRKFRPLVALGAVLQKWSDQSKVEFQGNEQVFFKISGND